MTPLKAEYKDLYQRELDRREELNNAIEKPLGVVASLFAGWYFCLHDLPSQLTPMTIVQLMTGALIIALLVLAVFEVIASTYNHTYGFIPTPRDIETWRRQLADYHVEDRQLADSEIDQKALDYIYSAYAEAAHQNALVNDVRSARLHRAKKWIVFAFPAVLAAGMLKVVASNHFTGWFTDIASFLRGTAT